MNNLYAIRDRLANAVFGMQMYVLFTFRTNDQAVRYFTDCIMDEKSILNKHPRDYELIHVGGYEEDGTLTPISRPEIVATGDAIVAALTPRISKEA